MAAGVYRSVPDNPMSLAARPTLTWTEANQLCLVAEFARLKKRLEGDFRVADSRDGAESAGGRPEPPCGRPEPASGHPEMERPPAFEQLRDIFELSRFELEIVLFAAGLEMDSAMASQSPRFTFGLAMALLDEPHWNALTPARPLRRYRLIEADFTHGANYGLTSAPLRIDERILHYLAGVNQPDGRLQNSIELSPFPSWIATEHKAIASEVGQKLRNGPAHAKPVLQLCGDDPHGQEDTASLATSQTGARLFTTRAEELPAPGADLEQFISLWEREALLLPAVLLVQCGSGGLNASARRVAENLSGALILAGSEPIHLGRPVLRFDVRKPGPQEQRQLWRNGLGSLATNLSGALDSISEQFRLSARTIHSTCSIINTGDCGSDAKSVWNICRSLARPRLENLARRLSPGAGWDDIVLPELQMATLRHLAAQVKHRMKVYEIWGFSAQGRRGLGVSALFCGESGTGKTLAAEVLARELDLDLYCIDLSAVVSKYIGETEKNLAQVFDAAEEGGALLLFDEADALFGKRSEAKDSHDRYANIEVGYLLQRMESYQGLAILTTNMKSSMDKSFQRRLRFIVNFPFPDASQREAIWSRVFPEGTPTEGLEPKKLAQLKVAGGNIRNIALNAAFLAAAQNTAQTTPVGMAHLLEAAGLEAQKMERPLSESEVRGWV